MELVIQMIKQLKFEGYTEDQIIKMVKENVDMSFDYSN